MQPPRAIHRYALYGEGNHAIAPEFLHIETIHARSSLYEGHIAAHAHPGIFQLLVLEAGGGTLLGDAAPAVLRPVSLVAVPPGCVHAFRFTPDAQGWVLSVADALLHDARLAALLGAMPQGAPRQRQLDPDRPESQRLGWLLADLAAAGGVILSPPLLAELALVLTLASGLLADTSGEPARRAGHDALVARYRRLVEAHFRAGWGIGRYAAALATTPPTLTRACRAVLGRAPGEVVRERLLLEAMRLLTYTASTIGQIADELGFADPAYFARFFKARAGQTASQFRHTRAWLR